MFNRRESVVRREKHKARKRKRMRGRETETEREKERERERSLKEIICCIVGIIDTYFCFGKMTEKARGG